jgi:uncharacterized membrane protein
LYNWILANNISRSLSATYILFGITEVFSWAIFQLNSNNKTAFSQVSSAQTLKAGKTENFNISI